MTIQDLTNDPRFLNRKAWALRWEDRTESTALARRAKAECGAGASSEQGLACRTLAWHAKWRGNFNESAAQCTQALACLSEEHDKGALAQVHSILAVIHYSRGRRDLARDAVMNGFVCLGHAGPVEARIDLLASHASILRYAQKFTESRTLLDEALSLSDGAERARMHHNIARHLAFVEDHDAAWTHAQEALKLARRHNNRVILPYVLELLGAGSRRKGRLDAARTGLIEGLAISRADEDIRGQCQILQELALVEQDSGDRLAALAAAQDGLGLAAALSYPIWEKQFLLQIAQLHEANGYYASAMKTWKALYRLQERERD